MKKRKIIETGLIILFVVMFGTCAYLYARPSVTVENTFTTGVVNIGLDTYQINDDGAEEAWTDNPFVFPGAEISNIKRISNLGDESCYIRAKVVFQDIESMNYDHLLGISDNWILKEDGYWYYKPALRPEECTDLFTAIKIPNDLTNDRSLLSFSVNVLVDGLQTQNILPDYEANNPWGDVAILKSDTSGTDTISSVEAFQTFSVTYLGNVGQMVSNSDDFFANIPALYPGDQYCDTLELENDSNHTIILYFQSGMADQTDDLLKRMTMKIDLENRSGEVTNLYEGPIQTDAFAKEKEIIRLPAKSSALLHYTITMPHELDNSYTLKHKAIQWTFSTDVISNGLPTQNGIPVAPNTGDSSAIVLSFVGMLLSTLGLCLIFIGKRREDDDKNTTQIS